jgi:hypothetical protein
MYNTRITEFGKTKSSKSLRRENEIQTPNQQLEQKNHKNIIFKRQKRIIYRHTEKYKRLQKRQNILYDLDEYILNNIY